MSASKNFHLSFVGVLGFQRGSSWGRGVVFSNFDFSSTCRSGSQSSSTSGESPSSSRHFVSLAFVHYRGISTVSVVWAGSSTVMGEALGVVIRFHFGKTPFSLWPLFPFLSSVPLIPLFWKVVGSFDARFSRWAEGGRVSMVTGTVAFVNCFWTNRTRTVEDFPTKSTPTGTNSLSRGSSTDGVDPTADIPTQIQRSGYRIVRHLSRIERGRTGDPSVSSFVSLHRRTPVVRVQGTTESWIKTSKFFLKLQKPT